MRFAARVSLIASLLFVLLSGVAPFRAKQSGTEFQDWVAALRDEALSLNISPQTLDVALGEIELLERVVELDRDQPEFTLTFDQYLDRIVTRKRVSTGKQKLREHRALLEELREAYGVQPRFIVALWGIESNFGTRTGSFPVIDSLATLAYDGRRGAFFRRELLDALTILDEGHIEREKMLGSWSGAMGQPQFMPSSFRRYAVDHDGDSRRDIWGSVPDALASAANYLSGSGWRGDLIWGREVRLPGDFDASLVGRGKDRPLDRWQELGVRWSDGSDLPAVSVEGAIVRPDGNTGRAYLVYDNYSTLLKWNRSDFFATTVGPLSDRDRRALTCAAAPRIRPRGATTRPNCSTAQAPGVPGPDFGKLPGRRSAERIRDHGGGRGRGGRVSMVQRDGRRQVRFSILCGLLIVSAVAGAALAQDPGNATGVVTDDEGIPTAGAFVLVEGSSIAAISDPDGSYAVTGIPPGKHVLVVTYVSYRTERREVTILAGETITEHFTLMVDLLDLERVVVTGASNPRVKLESSVAITTRNSEEIEEDAPLSTTALLSSVPGFWAESSGGQTGGNLFTRGLPQDGSYRYVAMYEDGLPVFESPALSFANVDTFYRVDETVDVLEAVRGGSASVFASNSPGGLINFISKTGGEAPAGSLRLTLGDYGLFRGDFNYGGPIGDDWRFNVGGFYRFDSGIRDPDFLANQGGQARLNVTRIFDGGYVRFYFKGLDEKNVFYLPIPLRDADNPESIPGVNAQFGTMTSLDAAAVRVPTGDGHVRNMNLRDGVNPRVLSFGVEFYHELDHNWSLKNNTRYTDIDLNYNAVFSGADPAAADDYAADKLQEYNDSGIGPAAAAVQYSYATSGDPVADPATMNGNGLVLEYGWWNVQKPMSSFTNDLQLTRAFETHDLTLGLYFSTYRADDFWQFNDMLIEARNAPRMLNLEFLDAPGGNVVGAATQNGFTRYGSRYVRASNSAQVVALYANDEWEISDRFRLDAGLRYEYARYDGNTEVTAQYDISESNPISDAPVGQATPVPTLADRNLQWGTGQFLPYNWTFADWAGSVGVNYSVNNRLAVFGRLSSGFRQPTFDRWSVLAPGSTTITEGDSEEVRQAEAGVKMSTDSFGLFASVFYSRLDNVVFNDEVLDPSGNLVPRNGEANTETPGAEVELVWRPSPLWLLEGMLTLQRAEYRRFEQQTGSGTPLEFSGNRVRRIPDVILDFRPTFQVGRFKTFLDWTHVGERYSDDANTVKLPAYDTFDLGVIYAQSRTSYSLRLTNLFNEIGLTEGNPRSGQVVGSVSDVYLARPILGRAVRVSLAIQF